MKIFKDEQITTKQFAGEMREKERISVNPPPPMTRG